MGTSDWVLQVGGVVIGLTSGWLFVARTAAGGFFLLVLGELAWGTVVCSISGCLEFNSGGSLVHVHASVVPALLAALAGAAVTYALYRATGREAFPESDGGWSIGADDDGDGDGDGD